MEDLIKHQIEMIRNLAKVAKKNCIDVKDFEAGGYLKEVEVMLSELLERR